MKRFLQHYLFELTCISVVAVMVFITALAYATEGGTS